MLFVFVIYCFAGFWAITVLCLMWFCFGYCCLVLFGLGWDLWFCWFCFVDLCFICYLCGGLLCGWFCLLIFVDFAVGYCLVVCRVLPLCSVIVFGVVRVRVALVAEFGCCLGFGWVGLISFI